MNLGTLIHFIEKLDYDSFKNEFIKQKLSESDKQNLLVVILENGYNHKHFSFYKLVFDLVIDGRLNVNFITNDFFKTPFLFVVTKFAPYIELFEYFIDKGAKINFYHKQNEDDDSYDDFKTCLDNVETIIEDTVTDDLEGYYYNVKSNYSTIYDNKVCVDKEEYEQLIEQSSLLFNLRKLTILRNHIVATGGKRYCELNKKQ